MRISKEKAAENRSSLVRAASRLIRERGIDDVGVADISKAAGLTHGALYAHFRSKEELVLATRDDYAGSCPIAASASEIGRQERAISACFSEKYLAMVGAIERGMGQDGDKRARAMTIVAALVGAQAVARGAAKSDPALSEQVLRAARQVIGTLTS
jgi:TetR/AcrR family transcriptional repressor of nem operon